MWLKRKSVSATITSRFSFTAVSHSSLAGSRMVYARWLPSGATAYEPTPSSASVTW